MGFFFEDQLGMPVILWGLQAGNVEDDLRATGDLSAVAL